MLFLLFSRFQRVGFQSCFITFDYGRFYCYFYWKYLSKQNTKDAILLGLSLGILIQSNFAFVFFLLLLPLYYLIFKLKFKITDIIFFIVGLLISLSSYIVAEIKFHGRGILALIHYISTSHSSASASNLINLPIAIIINILSSYQFHCFHSQLFLLFLLS